MFKKTLLVVPLILSILGSTVLAAASAPASNKFVQLEYGDIGGSLYGYIPALSESVERAWELSRWDGIYRFSDNQERKVVNYDVFNVKKEQSDPNFDKENGFGLVYKSQDALSDLFDSIWSGQTISDKQRHYFKSRFAANADDSDLKRGHPFFYQIESKADFLRTSGIVQRMGVQFEETRKIDEDNRQAVYSVTKWPEMQVTLGTDLSINYTAYGVPNSMRQVDVFALPKGAFPDMSKRVKVTSITTDSATYTNTAKVVAEDISKMLGKNVDIVLDDGYGRTQIKSVTLPEDLRIDFVPTKLTLTEGGQLWVKYKYTGEDIVTTDYVNDRGMPMLAEVSVKGPASDSTNLASMNTSLPPELKNGMELNYMLGKVDVDSKPGTYRIKVVATINNPNHGDRALEAPTEAYHNNTIEDEWVIEVNDLIAESITASPNSIKVGEHTTVTAKVKNEGDKALSNVLIRFTEDGKKSIYETRKTLPANKSVSVGGFKWTGTPGVHSLTVEVDPDQEQKDVNRSNNLAYTSCSIINPREEETGKCKNPDVSANWITSYPVIVGYNKYGDPIWRYKDVNYNERLTISAEINTKQGIPTKPRDHSDAGRESRGSWEIIPWAKEHHLNPNEVTRAGYGVEFKVKTNYTTDWETKVPKGLDGTAKPIGTKLKGPDEVFVWVWDSRSKFVATLPLEKTSGNDRSATWELPQTFFETRSGPYKSYYERKYYTDKTVPDGEFTFVIVARYAGHNRLTACITKKMTIFGSMYDDSQAVRDTSAYQ
ncbi:CARDB domain-containing protein [Paenibacillus polymyxa]|uniref:CARDB domain-containing protein n=1 Tax=Paenibacillus polymyxa TaxID=1406 RepID=UPI002AB351FB|nr:CARDB domain-containing protein [Paenibacillus polymyxa]MDY7989832.1 CARDB domain-containing protein [Paenibacillus polymyxa]MDY8116809.1 CARDB domain-containing protein [Paenibacillus polymyxa]